MAGGSSTSGAPPISRTGVTHNGYPFTELHQALPPQFSRTFVASIIAVPKYIGDSFLEMPIKSTLISLLVWKNFGIITPLKLLGTALGVYSEDKLVHNTVSDFSENTFDTAQEGLQGLVTGFAKSLFKTAENFGTDAKDQWDEGMGRSFQNQAERRAYARSQLNGECIIDKDCHDDLIRGPGSGSFVLPAIFLLGTLGLCAYAYQLLTNEAEVKAKKVEKDSDRPTASKA